MAKTLTLSTKGGEQFKLLPQKIDRNKLYGYTELRAQNAEGAVCCQASINSDGVNIICPGATKIAVLDEKGNWVDKQSLIPTNEDGSVLKWIPSSFDGGINLTEEATLEDILDLTIQSVYQLTGEDVAGLVNEIGDRIFTFDFSYRGGFEANTAFMLASEGSLFLLSGVKGSFEYLGLEEVGELDGPDEDFNIEDGELDFSMM